MDKVFAVFDVKAAAFGSLVVCPTNGLALRMFAEVCANRESPMWKYPADYSLYELGTYDPATGKLVALPQPSVLCTASAVVAQLKAAAVVGDEGKVAEEVA